MMQLVFLKVLLNSCVTFPSDIYGLFYQFCEATLWYLARNKPNGLRYEISFFLVNCAYLSSTHVCKNILYFFREFFPGWYNVREIGEKMRFLRLSRLPPFSARYTKIESLSEYFNLPLFDIHMFPNFTLKWNSKTRRYC